MNERESRVDSLLSLVGKDFELVTFMSKGCLEKRKMNRRHGRSQEGVRLLIFFRKERLFIRIVFRYRYIGLLAMIHNKEK